MKKTFLIILFLIPFISKTQFLVNYPVYEYERYNQEWDSDDHNARIMNVFAAELSDPDITHWRIKTHIPINRENCFATVFIKGYDEVFGNINLQIGWHWFDGSFQALPTVSNSGTYIPKVNVGHDGENFCVTFDNEEGRLSNSHFEVSILVNGDINRQYFHISDFWWWEIDNEYLAEGLECRVYNRFDELVSNSINSKDLYSVNAKFKTLEVENNNRNYFVNRPILGNTIDNWGQANCPSGSVDACNKSYIILHQAYNNQTVPPNGLEDSYVMGKITARRGGIGEWNYKLSMDVNTATAHNSTRGSLINFMQDGVTRLVTLNYMPNGSTGATYRCLAIEINNPSSIYNFSFTGYAENYNLFLVAEKEPLSGVDGLVTKITGVQAFVNGLDPIALQGPLKLENLKNTTGDNILTTDINGKVVFSNSGGYWKQHNITVPLGNPKTIFYNGAIAIGVADASASIGNYGDYKLLVNGTVGVRKIKVTQSTSWADYVFKKDYKLMPLTQLNKFIKINGHLPEIPTEKDIFQNGNDIGETQVLLLKKIEELTIYIIQQQKEIDVLKKIVKKMSR